MVRLRISKSVSFVLNPADPGEANPGLDRTVELKTNKIIKNQHQENIFHKKLLKHWAQSWLLGVRVRPFRLPLFAEIRLRAKYDADHQSIFVGFRDDAGIVKDGAMFETAKIPRLYAPSPCL